LFVGVRHGGVDSGGPGENVMRRSWTERMIVVLTVGLVASFMLGGYAVNRGVDKEEATSILAGYADELRDDKVDLCKDPDNKPKPECSDPVPPKVEDLVEEPLPKPLPAVQGERGPGPTYAQILDVVLRVLPGIVKETCADNGCAKDGKDGKDAPPITAAEIAIAVANAIDEALARNCGGSCKAADGKDGRGIVDVDCSKTPPSFGREEFVITYTDGTTQTVVCKNTTQGE
jgi:hypothetical protein